ncbi:protein-L-isoaspartate(D-aspartate) O-methyltransferase [Sulfuriroseicoccus oceanibius]|uniref:Protein-L-isoaspartate O-methyltransferase n=1 Tax=Sulfuriroseicoccus oceanibius TaxID=2707525 RepID=A0A6B3LB14_9BACT|nr:protein-L-isoaspartate(D-aspartate) O-methyltransferase [Sulfuriroseicoccus oceanibius]QQL45646.1 protein-L-isoaspartate(D-aspartate) O-methyltransferase [Sulfuriroseicoccus oceanibius]
MSTRSHAMVREQLVPRGIMDPRVLAAMEAVPREEFVPEERRPDAYADGPLPIGHGQTISQPYIVAAMVQALRVGAEATVLDVGTGCGYLAAVLAQWVEKVCSIDCVPELVKAASDRLERLGVTNVECRVGDGSKGWPDPMLFDGIVVSCATPEVPPALIDQLGMDRRLVLPTGKPNGPQVLEVYRREAGGLVPVGEPIPVRFVPMV